MTDLRGGGVLGLAMLVRFLEQSPHHARPIMTSRQPLGAFDPMAPGFYPFACAGIGVTRALCELAGLRGASGAPAPADAPELACWPLLCGDAAAFDACYALGFRLLDRLFDEKRCGYLDFGPVAKQARRRVAVFFVAMDRPSSARGPAAAGSWIFRRARRRGGRELDIPSRRRRGRQPSGYSIERSQHRQGSLGHRNQYWIVRTGETPSTGHQRARTGSCRDRSAAEIVGRETLAGDFAAAAT